MKVKFNCKTCGKTIVEIENDYVSGMVGCGCSCYKIELVQPHLNHQIPFREWTEKECKWIPLKTEKELRQEVCDEIIEYIGGRSYFCERLEDLRNAKIFTDNLIDKIKQIRDKQRS